MDKKRRKTRKDSMQLGEEVFEIMIYYENISSRNFDLIDTSVHLASQIKKFVYVI